MHPWSTPVLIAICSEALYESDTFPERELAALVAAKIYYHLQEYDESMVFALGAGKLFDIEHQGEFEETIVGTSSSTWFYWSMLTAFATSSQMH